MWLTFPRNQQTAMIYVRACQNAHVRLLNGGQFSTVVYELELGSASNMKTSLIKDGFVVAEADTPDILNCLQDRLFYIGWSKGYIEIGQGSQNGRRILSYAEPSGQVLGPDDIHGLSVFTPVDVFGEWGIPRGGCK